MSEFVFDRANINSIVATLEAQKKSKRDYVLPASMLKVDDSGKLFLPLKDQRFAVGSRVFFKWEEAEQYLEAVKEDEGNEELKIVVEKGDARMTLTNTAVQGLCNRLGVPKRFYDSLGDRKMQDVGGRLLSDILAREPKRFMVRTLDGFARAVLSDSYKCMDNDSLFFAAVEKFAEVGAQIWQARLWDDGMELAAISPDLKAGVETLRNFGRADHKWYRPDNDGGKDMHNAAIRVSNSETGNGGLRVSIATFRSVCSNFAVISHEVSKMHIGRKVEVDENFSISAETQEKEGAYIWSAVKDGIANAFSPEKFKLLIDKLNGTTQVVIPVDQEVKAVDAVVAAYKIAEDKKARILAQVLGSGDRTQFGMIQAITAVAHQPETGCEMGSLMEEVGGALTEMPGAKFLELIA